jgi:hypothetical protein
MRSFARHVSTVAVTLVITVFLASPLLAQAQNRYLGRNFPVLIDSNGDGRPTPGVDQGVFPTLDSETPDLGSLDSPWLCGPFNNTLNFNLFSRVGGTGRYQNVQRLDHGGVTQSVSATSTSGNAATAFGMTTSLGNPLTGGQVLRSGSAGFVDQDGNGYYDGMRGTETGGPGFTFEVGFTGADITGDGHEDYLSLPAVQATALGVKSNFNCLNQATPAIFVPLADTNGDGRPDSVVLDLDADGVPDPEFLTSPFLEARVAVPNAENAVPALSRWGLLALVATISAAGWFLLQRRGLGLGF